MVATTIMVIDNKSRDSCDGIGGDDNSGDDNSGDGIGGYDNSGGIHGGGGDNDDNIARGTVETTLHFIPPRICTERM